MMLVFFLCPSELEALPERLSTYESGAKVEEREEERKKTISAQARFERNGGQSVEFLKKRRADFVNLFTFCI